jgi:hypothetical protein
MKQSLALLLLFASMPVVLHAQNRAPSALFEATQCLITEQHHWVNVQNVKELQLAYLADTRNFGGAKYLYVVVFTSPTRDRGSIFDIRIKDHKTYSIENNATFMNTPQGITFPQPPLGGTWTQNQLTTSLQQIFHRRKWFEAEVKYLIKPSTHLHCEANVEDVVETQ